MSIFKIIGIHTICLCPFCVHFVWLIRRDHSCVPDNGISWRARREPGFRRREVIDCLHNSVETNPDDNIVRPWRRFEHFQDLFLSEHIQVSFRSGLLSMKALFGPLLKLLYYYTLRAESNVTAPGSEVCELLQLSLDDSYVYKTPFILTGSSCARMPDNKSSTET